MADYHPLIARAIAGLDENTAEARRSLYERARAALVTQLRSTTPPLSESDITRERLALEEAIRKVEAEQARRGRLERPPVARTPLVITPPEPADEPAPAPAPAPSAPQATPSSAAPVEKPPAPAAAPPIPTATVAPPSRPSVAIEPEAPPEKPERWSPPSNGAPSGLQAEPPEETAAEPEQEREPAGLGKTLRTLRERFLPRKTAEEVPPWPRTAPPEETPERARDLRDLDEAEVPPEQPAPRKERVAAVAPAPAPAPAPAAIERAKPAPSRDYVPDELDYADEEPPRRRFSGMAVNIVIAAIVLVVLGALAAVAYRESGNLMAVMQMFRAPQQPQQQQQPQPREAAKGQPKIEDRVGVASPNRTTEPGAQTPAVAQRVVLYEEDPGDPAGKRYVGSAIWRTETVSPGPGLAPELAVKANIEIPDRRVTMAFTMVRNTDPKLPASHTIDVRFNLPADFSGGGIANVPGILMKQAEQTRGVPLAGIAVKVTDNVFLIGLSSVESDVQRNTQLLKERTWFDIPIVYSNGSRAILAMEKGTPGERAFNDAFTVWGRAGTAAAR